MVKPIDGAVDLDDPPWEVEPCKFVLDTAEQIARWLETGAIMGDFVCAICGGKFRKARLDAEADAEREALFPGHNNFGLVCEDCFEGDMPAAGRKDSDG